MLTTVEADDSRTVADAWSGLNPGIILCSFHSVLKEKPVTYRSVYRTRLIAVVTCVMPTAEERVASGALHAEFRCKSFRTS
jgi:hypothetical protein